MSFSELPQECQDLLFSYWSPSKEIKVRRIPYVEYRCLDEELRENLETYFDILPTLRFFRPEGYIQWREREDELRMQLEYSWI